MDIQIQSRKFWLIVLGLLLGLFIIGQGTIQTASAQTIGFATITTTSKDVYASPDTTSSKVDTVYQEDIVLLLGRTEDSAWVYVITSNLINGWITTVNIAADIPISTLPVTTPSNPIPVPPIATVPTVSTAFGVVNTGKLNVRSGPGVGYGIVTQVVQGETVTLLARNPESTWLYIRTSNNLEGWVNAKYITTSYPISALPAIGTPGAPTATPVPPGTATPVVPTAVPGTSVVTASTLNVRASAGLSYVRVDQVYSGNVLWVNGRNLDTTWVSVVTPDGVAGWVNSKYISSNINFTTLPVTSNTGTGIVLTGRLNVRANPGVGNTVLTSASQGANMTLIGRNSDNGWLYLRAPDGKEGWSRADMLGTTTNINALPVLAGAVPTSSVPTSVPPIAPPVTDPTNTAVIRACPNLACAVTGNVYSGLTITATGRSADSTWVYLTTSNGQQGWIPAQYVQLNIPINSLPVVN